jgi:hypothetical protein
MAKARLKPESAGVLPLRGPRLRYDIHGLD